MHLYYFCIKLRSGFANGNYSTFSLHIDKARKVAIIFLYNYHRLPSRSLFPNLVRYGGEIQQDKGIILVV